MNHSTGQRESVGTGRVNRLQHWEYGSRGISTDIMLVSWISNKIRIQGKNDAFLHPLRLGKQ